MVPGRTVSLDESRRRSHRLSRAKRARTIYYMKISAWQEGCDGLVARCTTVECAAVISVKAGLRHASGAI